MAECGHEWETRSGYSRGKPLKHRCNLPADVEHKFHYCQTCGSDTEPETYDEDGGP